MATSLPKGREIFHQKIVAIAQRKVEGSSTEDRDLFTEAMGNLLFRREGPVRIARTLTERQRFFGELLSGFTEIENTYLIISDCEMFFRRFPYSRTQVSKLRYLSYSISAFMNELYIIEQRMQSYKNMIKNRFRTSRRGLQARRMADSLGRLLDQTTNRHITIRGRHVHEERYGDRDIERLETLDLIKERKTFQRLYDSEYRKAQKSWANTAKNYARVLAVLMDAYFATLDEFLFTNGGALRYPDGGWSQK